MNEKPAKRIFFVTLFLLLAFATNAFGQFCAPPSPPPPPPPPPLPPYCSGPGGGGGSGAPGGGTTGPGGTSPAPAPPPACPSNSCLGSPCSVAFGNYTSRAIDLQVRTNGFPLALTRTYDSANPMDSIVGVGWTSNLSARLYYATYLVSTPSVYQKEANVVLPSGLRVRFTENQDGSFTAPAGRYDTLTKNGDGSFDYKTADGTTAYHFSATGLLRTIADQYGNTLTYDYDANDRLVRIDDSSGTGRYLEISYGADGRIATVGDNSGRVVEYAYSASGALISVTDAADRSFAYTYTTVRFGPLLTRITDPWGRIITDVSYDTLGRTTSYTEAGETYTYTYKYNNRTDQSSKVDSAGNRWVYTYSAAGAITARSFPGSQNRSAVYNTDGTIQSVTDEVGVRTSYTYGVQGRIESMTQDDGGSLAVRWEVTYDPNFPTKIASVLPKVPSTGAYATAWQGRRYEYHQAGSAAPGALWKVYHRRSDGVTDDLVSTYTYNTRGQVTSVTDAAGAVTDFAYDSAGNLHTVTLPANNAAGTRPVLTYAYDSLGRSTSVTNALEKITRYTWDAADRITSIELPSPAPLSPLDFMTTFSHDQTDPSHAGVIFTVTTDPNGKTTKQGYDQFGRRVKDIDALGNVTAFAYSKGNLQSVTDANGNTTTYGYDGRARVTTTTFPDGTQELYTYKADGLIATKRDRKLQTISYSYDALKRLKQKTYPNASTITYTYTGALVTQVVDTSVSPTETHVYSYDNRYRLSSNQQAGRGTISYTYDAANRIATHTIAGGPTTTYTYHPDGSTKSLEWTPIIGTFDYTYDLTGLYDTVTFPNGQTRSFTYDDHGRPTEVANLHPTAGDLGTFVYAYDIDHVTGNPTMLGQRTSMTTGGATTKYYYDAAYQLTRTDYPGANIHSWTYDAIGNRLTSTVNGTTATYTYGKIGSNPNNWLRMTNDGADVYTYDANGSTTAAGAMGFTWDVENRLASVTGSATATYKYDIVKRRTSTTSSATTAYLYNHYNVIAQTGAATTYFLVGPGSDEPLALSQGGTVAYYNVDGLNTVMSVTTPAGVVQNSYSYDVWGAPTAATEAIPQPFRYTGREISDVAGLWNYRARYYRPSSGRFLSEDPKRWSDELRNTYRYVGNKPVLFIDPSGMDYRPTGPIINFDPTPHVGYGEPGPGKEPTILPIPPPPPQLPGQPPVPGITPPWWDVDFICTDKGWEKIQGPGVMLGGSLYGKTSPPPPEWKPPFECPKKECPSS